MSFWKNYFVKFKNNYLIYALNKYYCLDIEDKESNWVECNKGLSNEFKKKIKAEEKIIMEEAQKLKLQGYGVMDNDVFKLKKIKDS